MIFQAVDAEAAVEYVMIFIDPILLIYYIIALALFVAFTFNKKELRGFILTFSLMVMSVIMMLSHAYEAEAVFVFLSGISSIFAIFYYRNKVKSTMIHGG